MGNTRLINVSVLVMDNDAGLKIEFLPTYEEAIRTLYENCGGVDQNTALDEMEAFINAYFEDDENGQRAEIASHEIEIEE